MLGPWASDYGPDQLYQQSGEPFWAIIESLSLSEALNASKNALSRAKSGSKPPSRDSYRAKLSQNPNFDP